MVKKIMINKKAKLTKEQVLHIAQLANLQLTEKEIAKFQKQLSETLSYVEILNELGTAKVRPTCQVTGLENVFRNDETTGSLSQEETLSGTKSKHNGYFKIKPIF